MSFETLNTEAKIPLKLYGFMEYFPLEKGFVTPVFSNGLNFYVQIVSDDNSISSFRKFYDPEHRVTQLPDTDIFKNEGDHCLYGFKQMDIIHFEIGDILSKYLEKVIDDCTENQYLYNNIKSFIGKHAAKEQTVRSVFPNKNELWDFCLKVISRNVENEVVEIFRNKVNPEIVHNNVLRVSFNSRLLKSEFERNFLDSISESLKAIYGPGFAVETIFKPLHPDVWDDGDHKETIWKFPGIQGSFKMNTCLRSYNHFDNFILTGANKKVYSTVLNFLAGNESTKNIVIVGASGMGKTHLAGASYNYLKRQNQYGVEALKVTPKAVLFEGAELRNVSEFYALTYRTEVVVIDDAHLLNDPLPFKGSYWKAIHEMMQTGKRFLLTYNNENFYNRHINEFVSKGFQSVSFNDFDYVDKLQILNGRAHVESFNLLKTYFLKLAAWSSSDIDTLLRKAILLQLSNNPFKNFLDIFYNDRKKISANLSLFGTNHAHNLLEDFVYKRMNKHGIIMPYLSDYDKSVLANDISLFVSELLISDRKKGLLDVYPMTNCSIDDSYIYWQQQFFDNIQFRQLIIDVFKDLNSGHSDI